MARVAHAVVGPAEELVRGIDGTPVLPSEEAGAAVVDEQAASTTADRVTAPSATRERPRVVLRRHRLRR
jgi:hypothetical protein